MRAGGGVRVSRGAASRLPPHPPRRHASALNSAEPRLLRPGDGARVEALRHPLLVERIEGPFWDPSFRTARRALSPAHRAPSALAARRARCAEGSSPRSLPASAPPRTGHEGPGRPVSRPRGGLHPSRLPLRRRLRPQHRRQDRGGQGARHRVPHGQSGDVRPGADGRRPLGALRPPSRAARPLPARDTRSLVLSAPSPARARRPSAAAGGPHPRGHRRRAVPLPLPLHLQRPRPEAAGAPARLHPPLPGDPRRGRRRHLPPRGAPRSPPPLPLAAPPRSAG